MVYVCAQIEDIFRFRRDRLGFYAEIQITFGTVYILAAIQITFGTVYMLGQAGRPADSLQIWSAKYPNRINALYSLCQAVLPSYTGVQDRTTEYHRTELMSSEVNNFRLQTWSLTKTKGCYISWFSTNKPLSTFKNITNLLVHQKLGVSAGKLQVSEI